MNAGILREKLGEGEQLLWTGSPVSGGDDTSKAPLPVIKSMYGAILKALIIPVVLATAAMIFILGRLACMALLFWVILAVLLVKYRSPEEWVYGITDKRVFIGTDKSGIAAYSFGDINDIQQYIGKNGIGCVTFTADGQACGLYGLNDTEKVCGILKAAKDNFLE